MNKCSKCHFINKEGAKFCTKCGNSLNTSPQKTVTENSNESKSNNESVNVDVSAVTNNFFNYFINSLTHPNMSKVGNDTYLGIVSLVIYIVLSFLGIFSVLSSFLNSNNLNISTSLNPLPNGMGITMSITALVTWVMVYVCITSIMKNKISMTNFNNNFGKFLNIGSSSLLIGILLSWILPSLLSLAFIFVLIGYLSIAIGSAYELFTVENNNRIESFYIALIILIIVFIINYICVRLFVIQPLRDNLNDLLRFI